MIKSIYLTSNFFYGIGLLICLFFIGSSMPFFLGIGRVVLLFYVLLIALEILQLYRYKKPFYATRQVADKLSNGEDNFVHVFLKNDMPFKIRYTLIDELPIQFQSRDKIFNGDMKGRAEETVQYKIRPNERGEYQFGSINVYVSSILHLVQRRFKSEADQMVKVYPSIIQVKKYGFLAISDHLEMVGVKKIRKIGHNYEFDQIREFVNGDDYRSINWKATARNSNLMVNQYQDEKSQDVYAIVNKGRVMQMPFDNLSLLDYAINSALVMLNTAFVKDDHPGLLTFNKKVQTFLPASKKSKQITHVLETLYNQETDFSEADYAKLTFQIRKSIKRRGLLFLYTHFEGLVSLRRELNYLKTISKYHRLIVVIFRNTELDSFIEKEVNDLEGIYVKTIASKFQQEKELIVRELKNHGIDSVLTTPEDLTVNTVNKYLEIKARHLV